LNKTKIDWCDLSWNPITGCLANCEYCFARGIARRFGGRYIQTFGRNSKISDGELHELGVPHLYERKNGDLVKAAYPYSFDPTFHRYRLDELTRINNPQNVFVGSMTDIFGEWIPDEWIEEVFKACKSAPQHRYMFLTKNSKRYISMAERLHYLSGTQYSAPETWIGTTISNCGDEYVSLDWIGSHYGFDNPKNHFRFRCFLSIEPLHEHIKTLPLNGIEWVIIGAETGRRRDKVIPKHEWIEAIREQCYAAKVPVFMKSNLADVWGEHLIQEYPWMIRK